MLEIRKRRSWGARKIRRVLENDPDVTCVPSVDTIHRILQRHGKVEPRTPRRRRTHPSAPPLDPEEPNATWTADFKGEFRTRDGHLCFPLTMQDGYSRFLLECRGMLRLDLQATLQRFRDLFREFGLPRRIRTDNGHPFASNAIARLSKLSVWWVTLGIIPEFIEPGKPQQNPRHERMHRDLKRETALPPRANLRAQQRRFNKFRRIYNFERPHEGLGMDIPSERFRPSPRSYEEPPSHSSTGLFRGCGSSPRIRPFAGTAARSSSATSSAASTWGSSKSPRPYGPCILVPSPRLARRSRLSHHGRYGTEKETPLNCKRCPKYLL